MPPLTAPTTEYATARRALCICIALAGVLLRVGIALRPLDLVDRLFIPDDTYYTLSVARSLARGLGPTADGLHLTNGFQPLLGFLLVPVFWLASGLDAPLRATLLLLALCDGAAAFLMGELARRATPEHGAAAAVLATTAWVVSPFAVGYALGGLETSLAIAVTVATVIAWDRAHKQASDRAYALAGAVAGLALLARIDAAFVLVAIGATELCFGSRRGALVAVIVAVLVVSPWWSYELLRLGSIIPESGAAVHEQVRYHQMIHLTVPTQVAYALGTLIEPAFARAVDARDLLSSAPWLAVALAPFALAALVCATVRATANRVVRAYLFAAPVFCAFYTFYLPAVWFFPRYLAPVHASLTVLLSALGAAWLQQARRSRPIATGVIGLGLVGSAVSSFAYALISPGGTVDTGLHGAKGYREPARQILAMLPPGAVVGAFQSGALGYYAHGSGARVVNLDGVVDKRAGTAFRTSSMVHFARSAGVMYLADWEFNIAAFNARAGDGRWGDSCLTVRGLSRSQGPDRFTLYEVRWPNG